MSEIQFSGAWQLLSEKPPKNGSNILIAFKSGIVREANYTDYLEPSVSYYPYIYTISDEPDLFDDAYWCYTPEHPTRNPKRETTKSDGVAKSFAESVVDHRKNLEVKKLPRMLEHIKQCLLRLDSETRASIEYVKVSEGVYRYASDHYAKPLWSDCSLLGVKLKPEPSFDLDRFHIVTKRGGTIVMK